MENQPGKYDAVLGGKDITPVDGVVLGGLEGVKRRFGSGGFDYKVAAVAEGLKYGEGGLQWVIQVLEEESQQLELAVYALLREESLDVDYSLLKILLARGKWQEADTETAALMLRISRREEEGFMTVSDMEKFPCEDMQMMESLWQEYSKGRFGFTVQTQIWQNIAGKSDPDWNAWCRFGEHVGWCQHENWLLWNDITFDIDAPVGHLPRGGAYIGWGLGDFWTGCRMLSAMTSKLISCDLILNNH